MAGYSIHLVGGPFDGTKLQGFPLAPNGEPQDFITMRSHEYPKEVCYERDNLVVCLPGEPVTYKFDPDGEP